MMVTKWLHGCNHMVDERRREDTTVIRIPKDTYEEAEKVRRKLRDRPRDGSDPFAIIAAAGIGAFIGGLVGFALANMDKNNRSVRDEEGEGRL